MPEKKENTVNISYMDCMDYTEIMEQISDINKGDIVYIVSDVLELAKAVRESGQVFRQDDLIDSIIRKVGKSGTVLFPAFNWGFCKGEPFDYVKTPSMTGALSKAALKRTDFKRTQHPIYSFAVWGKEQEYLCSLDYPNSFGTGSIFDYLYQNAAKALVIGLPVLAGLTFLHHVEQMVGVPYRYEKDFTADYTDRNGQKTVRTYSMYVRDLDMDPQELVIPLGDIMEALSISKTRHFYQVPFRTVLLREMYVVEELDIRLNDSRNIYMYIGQKEPGE